MRVNKKTMLFEDFTLEERNEMLDFTIALVMRGERPPYLPDWVKLWLTTFEYDERQALLVLATAFPQRVLLSLLLNADDDRRISVDKPK